MAGLKVKLYFEDRNSEIAEDVHAQLTAWALISQKNLCACIDYPPRPR
jgi:hypothetical protein